MHLQEFSVNWCLLSVVGRWVEEDRYCCLGKTKRERERRWRSELKEVERVGEKRRGIYIDRLSERKGEEEGERQTREEDKVIKKQLFQEPQGQQVNT